MEFAARIPCESASTATKRHGHRFPATAIPCCIEAVRISSADLDNVCFYDKPLRKFDRLLETHFALAPAGAPFLL